ncbi:MAG: hypothetical protein LLG14_27270 [Nocardiaceae bacterium]|nr:hypothetical protein [Nocardiaceae bacterium]
MPTQSYRETYRPALIDTNIPTDGRANAAAALAQTFKDFEAVGANRLGQLRAEQGRREGAEAGRTNDPHFRTGLASTTAYGQAYNDAATRSYVIQSEAAADDAAIRLEIEAANDPDVFRATFGARRDAILKEAPEGARAILAEVYDRRMADSVNRLIGARGLEMQKAAQADVVEGIRRSTDRIAQLRASDDPAKQELAEEEQVKQDMLIESARRDGTLTQTEVGALRIDAARSVTAQTVTYRFRAEMDNPYGDPVAFIERLKEANKTSNALPPDEEEKLVTGLLNELQEKNALAAAGRNNMKNAQEIRWALGDNFATNAMIEGTLTTNKLSRMLEEDEIDPSVARTLYNELQAGNDRPDDEKERFSVETTLLEHTEQEIGQNAKLSWKTRRELIEKRRQMSQTWRGTQQAQEGAARIDRALRILPGTPTALLDANTARQREAALTAWYDQVDGMPEDKRQAAAIEAAEKVADEVIRGNNNRKLEKMRQRLEAVKRAAGPVDEMGEQERADYEKDIADREAKIKALEQAAK